MLDQVNTALLAPGALVFEFLGLTAHGSQITVLYLALGFAVWAIWRSRKAHIARHWGQILTAEITGVVCDGRHPDYPRVTFTDAGGETVCRLADTPCTDETCRIGSKIPVMYDPASRRCEAYHDDTPLQQRRHLFSFLLFACLISFSLGAGLPVQMMA